MSELLNDSQETIQRLRTEAETIISMRRDHPGYGTSPIFLNAAADTIESLQADRELALARLSESKDKVKALQAEVEALKQVNAVRFRQLDCLTNGNAEQGCGHVH